METEFTVSELRANISDPKVTCVCMVSDLGKIELRIETEKAAVFTLASKVPVIFKV